MALFLQDPCKIKTKIINSPSRAVIFQQRYEVFKLTCSFPALAPPWSWEEASFLHNSIRQEGKSEGGEKYSSWSLWQIQSRKIP